MERRIQPASQNGLSTPYRSERQGAARAFSVGMGRSFAECAFHLENMGNPSTGVMFHSGDGKPMDLDKLAQQVIRPLVKPLGWAGMAGMGSGVASRRPCMSWRRMRK